MIYHGKVFVNSQKIITKAFILTPGDVIAIKSKFNKLLRNYIQNSNNWPICPKHLIVNYKTMQIVYGSLQNNNIALNIFYYLNIEKLLLLFRLSLVAQLGRAVGC